MNRIFHIVGGGTVAHSHVHLATCAPAYGGTARKVADILSERFDKGTRDVHLHLTKMAGGGPQCGDRRVGRFHGWARLETNFDLHNLARDIVTDPLSKIVFWNPAIVDHRIETPDHRSDARLSSIESVRATLVPESIKIVETFRAGNGGRKDLFLVATKATANATHEQMYLAGLDLCKRASANLVLVNDVITRWNMIVTPEEAAYHEGADREATLRGMVEMAILRSNLTFTHSTVVGGELVPWASDEVPEALRAVVDHCVVGKAYKTFRGSTVGHFAHRIDETTFLTSVRKSDFNNLGEPGNGLVRIKTDGPDTVVAYGAKPSVGGQSQRIVFAEHEGFDCIFHAHVPLRENHPDAIPVVSQREVECGSHECGRNTSRGLASFADGKIKAVMLDKHGPNIVFFKHVDPAIVIDFIESNFDLSKKTGGYQLPS
jgi:hypothetical protein